jgi:hypothetical protein
MKRKIGAGTTSLIERIFLRDISVTTKVAGLTGLSFNNPGLTCYYSRAGAVGSTAVTLVTATVGTWVSGGFKEIDAVNMPGWYEFSVPNAAIAAGAPSVGFHFKGATNMEDVPLQFELDAVNYQDAVHFGLTSLPNAAAAANGGLPTVDASNAVKVQSGTGANQISLNAGLVAIDTTRTFAVRNQDAITAPTIADALQGGWSAAFAKEAGANNSTAFAVRLPDNSGPARTFTLDAALSSGPFSRS